MSLDVTLKLGRSDHGRAVTQTEFETADFEEPWRYERVAGRLSVLPPGGAEFGPIETAGPAWTQHSNLVEDLRDVFTLTYFMRGDWRGIEKIRHAAWIRIDGQTERIADLAVYLEGPRSDDEIPDRVPDVVFEIVSRGSVVRDYEEKPLEYARVGVREYVVLDRFEAGVTVFRRAAHGRFARQWLGPAEPYTTPFLPGFTFSLAQLLTRSLRD